MKIPSMAESEGAAFARKYGTSTSTDTAYMFSNSFSSCSYEIDDYNNNATILLYTLTAFIVIKGIAWYVCRYHPNALIKTSEVTNNENLLYSINEDFYSLPFTNYISILIPAFILIMYKLRYY